MLINEHSDCDCDRLRKDERLSRPSWLTYNGRLNNISGHASVLGRAPERETWPVTD